MHHGGGVHIWDLELKNFFALVYVRPPPASLTQTLLFQWIMVDACIYGVAIILIKVSILLQYLRIFVPNRKADMPLYILIHACIWMNVIYYITNLFLTIFACTPRRKLWDPLTSGECIDVNALYQSSGVINAVSDFMILILPIKPILALQVPTRRKLPTLAIFATGVFACITSVIRTRATWQFVNSPDKSYFTVTEGVWAWAEITAGIFVSCVPVLPRFLQHVRSKVGKNLRFKFNPISWKLVTRSKDTTDQSRAILNASASRRAMHRSAGRGAFENSAESEQSKYLAEGRYLELDDYDRMFTGDESTKNAAKRHDLEHASSGA
ncbi:MAG: hypothetical protein Q9195_009105 [Heterodermia aff. obscurata]